MNTWARCLGGIEVKLGHGDTMNDTTIKYEKLGYAWPQVRGL
jgi:hypothetical protein